MFRYLFKLHLHFPLEQFRFQAVLLTELMMMIWNADDRHERWIYRTIYPSEFEIAEHRMIQFKNMEEMDAEADWNFDEHLASGLPLKMSMRRTLTEEFPKGLSFFSFANDHEDAVISADFPLQAEIGQVFTVIVENNQAIASTNAYKQIVMKGSQPRKIRNGANAEVTLKTFICYKANSESLRNAGSPFCCTYDNNPPNHRTVAPAEAALIDCVCRKVSGRLAAEPITQPTLYTMLGFRMHCFRMRAAAEPKPLLPSFNRDVHRLACVFYRGFDTDCSEEDSRNIVAILTFLEQNDYRLSALKLLKKECIIKLLNSLFSNECLDEKETKEVEGCLFWIRNDFEQLIVDDDFEF